MFLVKPDSFIVILRIVLESCITMHLDLLELNACSLFSTNDDRVEIEILIFYSTNGFRSANIVALAGYI